MDFRQIHGRLFLSSIASVALFAAEANDFVIPVGAETCIDSARAKVRKALDAGLVPKGADAVLLFAPGRYDIPQALTLDASDGGREDGGRVIWRAAVPGKTILTRGRPVMPDRMKPLTEKDANFGRFPIAARAKMLKVDVADRYPRGVPVESDVNEHFPPPVVPMIDDEPLVCARWPNRGAYASFDQAKDIGIRKNELTERNETSPGAFYWDDPRLRRWRFDDGVRFAGYWNVDWHCHYVKASGLETNDGRVAVRLAAPVSTGLCVEGAKAKPRRFYAYDLPEELDAPGEYWFDRRNRSFYFIPPKGAALSDGLHLADAGTRIMTGEGVNRIRFEGLSFCGFAGDGVFVAGNDVVFSNCTFRGIAGKSLKLTGWSNRVERCEFCHIGRDAIEIRGGDRERLIPSGAVVEGCSISDWGIFQRSYAGGIRLSGCGMTIRGNHLWNAPHSAVFLEGNEHLVESNDVHDVLLDTGDCGAYYMGRDRTNQGNVLRWNFTHDLGSSEFSTGDRVGFYFDDCDCGTAAYSNVFLRVSRGILIGGGRDHPIVGNVFAQCRLGVSIDVRGRGYASKLIDIAPSWCLTAKCERMRYREEPWRSRYPNLAKILSDEPEYPKYNPILGNLFVECEEAVRLETWKYDIPDSIFRAEGNLFVEGARPMAAPDARIRTGFRKVSVAEAADRFGCFFGASQRGSGLSVAIPVDADRTVEIAAEEFCSYCEKITGFRPSVVKGACAVGSGRLVRIGFGCPDRFLHEDGDAYTVKGDGAGLSICGSNSRSVLYGVYDYFRRYCGCCWFWDGEVVPKRPTVEFMGVDIRERAQFPYRGCQYFAHRGLTRFQAEHWGLDDWKREIDWCVKNRLNVFFMQFGAEDLFQRAYPDIVPYPDPAKTQPCDAKKGYNQRSPFWSLQYRSKLRSAVLAYARERGMTHPEKIGPMTHWFSRTPPEFLAAKRPDTMPQIDDRYAEPSGLMWDVRQRTWFDEYWNLTEAACAAYGEPGLFFNTGFDERVVYSNREDNVRLKIDVISRYNHECHRRRPNVPAVLEGWDLFFTWRPEEVRELIDRLNPETDVIWDFTADETGLRAYPWVPKENVFSGWGVVKSFPYTFGFMLELNRGMDIRGNYEVIRRRERAIVGDPMCRGYLIWPEASHTDIFAWRYFTDNCWRLSPRTTEELLHDFCRDRYGEQAVDLERVWRTILPVSTLADWFGTCAHDIVRTFPEGRNDAARWLERSLPKEMRMVRSVFAELEKVKWTDDFVRRDTVDLARTALDRSITASGAEMLRVWHQAASKRATGEEVRAAAERYAGFVAAFADVLSLHEDYSLTESLDRLNAVERIRNPDFERILFQNASCDYCMSHQSEFARGCYVPMADELADAVISRSSRGDYLALPSIADRRQMMSMSTHPIRVHAPDPASRTEERFRRTMTRVKELSWK